VAVIAVGGLLIMGGELSYVDLLTFSLYITTFVNPIRRLSQFSETYMQGMAGFSRFLEVMNTEPAVTDAPDAKTIGEVAGEVEYRDVSFCYQNGLPVLRHVNLHVRPGECLALVGPSGGGKTTAASLIPRFWDVSDGAVEVGGVDVRDTDPHVLMDQVAFVFQNNRLFKSSILENVRAARPEATREEVRQALSAAQCDDILEKLPEGMDTVIGTEGTYLSGGEQQRAALARAILKDAPIVVLDEATAFADPENEAMIQKAFAALTKDRTVIMIAHRLSTVVNADKIIVLDSGRVEEQGTHAELVRANGLYARMWADYNQAVQWKISAAEVK
jgi:ATP-binding cassette subfamily B protein